MNHDDVCNFLVGEIVARPLGELPGILPPADFTIEEDIRIIAEGAAHACHLVKARAVARNEEYVLTQIKRLATQEEADQLPPDIWRNITRILTENPQIMGKIPADTADIRLYSTQCWDVVQMLADQTQDFERLNHIIQAAIVQPMSTIHHNHLAGIIFNRIELVSTETLFLYLSAVETSCHYSQQKDKRSPQIQHHVRHTIMVFEKALGTRREYIDQDILSALSSFCLSYPWVKKAADFFGQQLTNAQKQEQD